MKKTAFIVTVLLFIALAVSAQSTTSDNQLRMTPGFWTYSFYVGDQKVSHTEFTNVFKQNENAYKLFRSGKTLTTIGTIIGSVGAFCVGYDLGSRLGGSSGEPGLLIGGGIVVIGGVAMGLIGEAKMKKAIKLFNNKDSAYDLQFNVSPFGVGLCMNF